MDMLKAIIENIRNFPLLIKLCIFAVIIAATALLLFYPKNLFKKTTSEERIVYRKIQELLVSFYYSLFTLNNLPISPESTEPNRLVFANSDIMMRKFKLNKPERHYVFYPTLEDDKIVFKVMFFSLSDIDIKKDELASIFKDSREMNYVYSLIEYIEQSYNCYYIILDGIPDGDPKQIESYSKYGPSIPHFQDMIKPKEGQITPHFQDILRTRWFRSQKIHEIDKKIESTVTSLQDKFNAPIIIKRLTDTINDTMGKYNREVTINDDSTEIKYTPKK